MQPYYLYFDNYTFSDCFSTNSILAETWMPNLKGSRTISRTTDRFLFITHKKLDSNCRSNGITDRLTSWPVVLEIDSDPAVIKKFPVLFLKNGAEGFYIETGDIKDYNQSECIGCFIYKEIPFSFITKILFENEDQLADSDKSVFPDFLWRDDIVNVINQEAFNDTLELTVKEEDLYKYLPETIIESAAIYDLKYKAAVLQFINGTQNWKYEKYRTSFDKYFIQYFGFSTDVVKEILQSKNMRIDDGIFDVNAESLDLIPLDNNLETASQNQLVYDHIVNAFLANAQKCTPDVIHLLLQQIDTSIENVFGDDIASIYKRALESIEQCYLNAIGYGADSVINFIETAISKDSVLKALLFVVKNPVEYEKFQISLSAYQVDCITVRRANILWGFLNGTKGIPAHGYHRDIPWLWRRIEGKVSVLLSEDFACEMIESNILTEPKSIYDLFFTEEIITYEDVYAHVSSSYDSIPKSILKEIYSIARTIDRKLAKNNPYCRYEATVPGRVICDMLTKNNYLLSGNDVDHISKLIKDLKKKEIIDYEAVFRDWIKNENNFKKIWIHGEPILKEYYKKR